MLASCYRKTVGRLFMLFRWLTRPEPMMRTERERKDLAKETCRMSLYDYKGCPSSLKTRLEIDRLNLEIERRDIRHSSIYQDSLLAEFGELKAPCLRIEEHGKVVWLSEQDDIVDYLHHRFGASSEGLHV